MDLSYKAVESLLSRARAYVRAAVATSWVFLARLRRRGLDVPDGVPAMAFAALVTAAVFAPPTTMSNVAVPGEVSPAPVAAVAAPRPVAVRADPAGAARPAPAPAPAADDDVPPAPPSEPPLPPLPTDIPTDPCDFRLPHAEACVPFDQYQPGESLRNCVYYGPAVSASGVECRTS